LENNLFVHHEDIKAKRNQTKMSNNMEIRSEKEQIAFESICYGSLDFCIKHNFYGKEEAIAIFSTINPTCNVYASYEAFCRIFPIGEHYLENGEFLLSHNILLSPVAIHYYGHSVYDALLNKNKPEGGNFTTFIDPSEYNDFEDYKKIYKTYNTKTQKIYNFLSRKERFIGLTYFEETYFFVRSDWLEKYRKNIYSIALIVKRMKHLETKATHYFNAMKPFFLEKLKELFSDPEYTKKITKHICDEILSMFPDFGIAYTNPMSLYLSIIDPMLSGYYLGLPIHEMCPDKEMIKKYAGILEEMGTEKYGAFMLSVTKQVLHKTPWHIENELSVVNDRDTIMDSIEDYNIFDVFKVCGPEKVYFFTRPEYNCLVEKKINFWTNEPFHLCYMENIRTRLIIAEQYELPEPSTYLHTLKELANNRFFTATLKETIAMYKEIDLKEVERFGDNMARNILAYLYSEEGVLDLVENGSNMEN
jgi:hypothetical protein